MEKKLTDFIYVLDTNVIIQDPHCLENLKGDIVIPHVVIRELDAQKGGTDEKARNIRKFATFLNEGAHKNVIIDNSDVKGIDNDDRIIEITKGYAHNYEKKSVILLTNDNFMSVLANSKGVKTQKHLNRPAKIEPYSGLLDARDIDLDESTLMPNQYVIRPNGLYKYQDKLKRVGKDVEVWGLTHKNVQQRCALDALMDDSIKLVTLVGKAGSGKTLVSIAAGLEQTIGYQHYRKMLVARPIIPMGNDLGFLPGEINDKLGPWMQPIFDNIDFLFNKQGRVSNDNWITLVEQGFLKLEALTYIRGRSISQQFVLIDEAQNMSKHEVKTVISRMGANSKIILTGDPDQIDNPKLNSYNNGLSYVVSKFKDQKIAAHITMEKCERSELADIAAKIL